MWLGVFKSVGVKGKLQRQKKFLWITYWGESFADEMSVGCENMDLRIDYNFPLPQQYNLLDRPYFKGITPNFKVGNFAFDVLDIDINTKLNFFGYTYKLTTVNFLNMANGNFNSFIGSQYNNHFKSIQDDLIKSFDPSFGTRYAAYTAKVNTLTENNKYRIALGFTEKKQGYSHSNNWNMDANGGLTVKIGQNSSVEGTAYDYTMKAGSFFGKARVGSNWYKIRFVIQ